MFQTFFLFVFWRPCHKKKGNVIPWILFSFSLIRQFLSRRVSAKKQLLRNKVSSSSCDFLNRFFFYYYSAAAKYFVFLGETERERLFSRFPLKTKESLPPSSSTFFPLCFWKEFCCAPGTFPVKSVIKMSDNGSDFVQFFFQNSALILIII